MIAMKPLRCVICGAPIVDRKPGQPPFCSERCRLIDLGKWASGEYSVPAEESAPSEDDDPGPTGYGGEGETIH